MKHTSKNITLPLPVNGGLNLLSLSRAERVKYLLHIYYYLFIYFSNHTWREFRHWWSALFHRWLMIRHLWCLVTRDVIHDDWSVAVSSVTGNLHDVINAGDRWIGYLTPLRFPAHEGRLLCHDVYCCFRFESSAGRNYINNYLFFLHPLFQQMWRGRNSSCNFSPGNKKDAALSASTYESLVRRQSISLPAYCNHP